MASRLTDDCWDLAIVALGFYPHLDTTKNAEDLAFLIESVLKNFIKLKNDNYDPPDMGDAWSGGFADNH